MKRIFYLLIGISMVFAGLVVPALLESGCGALISPGLIVVVLGGVLVLVYADPPAHKARLFDSVIQAAKSLNGRGRGASLLLVAGVGLGLLFVSCGSAPVRAIPIEQIDFTPLVEEAESVRASGPDTSPRERALSEQVQNLIDALNDAVSARDSAIQAGDTLAGELESQRDTVETLRRKGALWDGFRFGSFVVIGLISSVIALIIASRLRSMTPLSLLSLLRRGGGESKV